MIKVIIYTRVSTREQTTENQLPVLHKWVTDRGFKLVEVYSENESAWHRGHQRELARLFNDLPRRKVDICLVWSLDRLSRQGVAAILNLVDRFKRHRVKVISFQESWTEAPGDMADLLYAITGWVANFESRRRSERTKAGLARAVAIGKRLGRPKGSRDKKKRGRSGYLLRYAHEDLKEKYGK
ncbi:recombinase family protein [Chloroflexota bacterium]